MPGTWVHDATGPKLADVADITSTAAGSAVNVGKPGDVRVRLVVTGAVTGTNPTLDIEIQSSDDSTFATYVSHGKFVQLTATDASSASVRYLSALVPNTYMRYSGTIGGTSTPTFNDVTITVEEESYHRKVTDSA